MRVASRAVSACGAESIAIGWADAAEQTPAGGVYFIWFGRDGVAVKLLRHVHNAEGGQSVSRHSDGVRGPDRSRRGQFERSWGGDGLAQGGISLRRARLSSLPDPN